VLENSQAVAAIAIAELAEPLRAHAFKKGLIVAGGAIPSATAFESMLQARGELVPHADTRANDPAFFVYTSGTTGKPKGIVHAHRWVIALGDSNSLRVPPQANDVVISTGEWSFIAALGQNLLFPLRNGVCAAILTGRAVPDNILKTIEQLHVTLLYSVATIYRRILAIDGIEGRYDLSSLRGCNSTGEPLEKATYEEWTRRIECPIWEHYGISEMQMVFGQGPQLPPRPGSVGPPLPGTTVAVLDDEYRPVLPGTVGNLMIGADNPGFFLGYNKNPELTAHVMRNGWYHTGDLASQDADGYIWIAGRSDDCFKSRGIFISPVEIENALREHPAVAEACVVPRPDSEIGNQIRAVIALKASYKPNNQLAEEIKASLTNRIARYKIPHTVEFSENIPKSAVGKVLRRVLRDAP
jgi:acyl-coenzyme A synthetase/AMP-(fatty) acid ligase